MPLCSCNTQICQKVWCNTWICGNLRNVTLQPCVCVCVCAKECMRVGVCAQICENLWHFARASQNRLPERISYIHTHTHTYTHTYIHTHIHTHTHTYTHTYIHTHTLACMMTWYTDLRKSVTFCASVWKQAHWKTPRISGTSLLRKLYVSFAEMICLFGGNNMSLLHITHAYSMHVAAPIVHILLFRLFCGDDMPLLRK